MNNNISVISEEYVDTSVLSYGSNENEENVSGNEKLLKILVIGDYGVGKTSIVRRYTQGHFATEYKITIGVDFGVRRLHSPEVTVQLWDIAGHERFGTMTRVYYKYASAVAVVCDVTRIFTIQSLQKWVKDVRDKVCLPGGEPLPVAILVNKSDLINSQNPDEIYKAVEKASEDLGSCKPFYTSAKFNENIDDAIKYLINCALESENSEVFIPSIKLQEANNQEVRSGFCCR